MDTATYFPPLDVQPVLAPAEKAALLHAYRSEASAAAIKRQWEQTRQRVAEWYEVNGANPVS